MFNRRKSIIAVCICAALAAICVYTLGCFGSIENGTYKGHVYLMSDMLPYEYITVLSSPDLATADYVCFIRLADQDLKIVGYADAPVGENSAGDYMTTLRDDKGIGYGETGNLTVQYKYRYVRVEPQMHDYIEQYAEEQFWVWSNDKAEVPERCTKYAGLRPNLIPVLLKHVQRYAKVKIHLHDPSVEKRDYIGYIPTFLLSKHKQNEGIAPKLPEIAEQLGAKKGISFLQYVTDITDMMGLFEGAFYAGLWTVLDKGSPVAIDRYIDYNDPSCQEYRKWIINEFLPAGVIGFFTGIAQEKTKREGGDVIGIFNLTLSWATVARPKDFQKRNVVVSIHASDSHKPLQITKIEFEEPLPKMCSLDTSGLAKKMSKPLKWDDTDEKEQDVINSDAKILREYSGKK